MMFWRRHPTSRLRLFDVLAADAMPTKPLHRPILLD
jgi:hypothetical protein